LLQRVIEKQVSEDFMKGEQQIKDYINRFQSEFDQLLKQRATREVEAPEIVAKLEVKKEELSVYLSELAAIRVLLDSWKPASKSEFVPLNSWNQNATNCPGLSWDLKSSYKSS